MKKYFSDHNKNLEDLCENLNGDMDKIKDTQAKKDAELSNLD